jgi:uncharacterized protein (TIGR02391 family)
MPDAFAPIVKANKTMPAKRKGIKAKRKPPEIEFKETIGESGEFHMIRLSRIKYKDNPSIFIDLRVFQRGYDEDGQDVYHPTKKGVQILESAFQRLIGKWTLIPSALLHPVIIDRAFPLLTAGHYESAVFQAYKAVEVRVRAAARLTADNVGTALMRSAFDARKGSLSDKRMPTAEREAMAHLFAGSIGLYKNPCSHRDVDLDFADTFEMVLLASHLLKIVDKVGKIGTP